MPHRLLISRCIVFLFASILLIPARTAFAEAPAPPTGLPVGSIVAFLPDFQPGSYSDSNGLRNWLSAQGWAICDGSDGTPDLHNRVLLGTERPEDTGQSLGSLNHNHHVSGETVRRGARAVRIRDGIRHPVQIPDEHHQHKVDGKTDKADNLPPSTRVLFIMKVRDIALAPHEPLSPASK